MSIFYCAGCDQQKDADYDGCNQYLDKEGTEYCDACDMNTFFIENTQIFRQMEV